MVDVSGKAATSRRAVAEGFVSLSAAHLSAIAGLAKGDVLTVAQIAGILAAKKTPELIPLCHSLQLANVDVAFEITSDGIGISATAKTDAQTGVEMEALTAVSVAALTIYDMLKAIGPEIEITQIRLMEKTGGKADWKRIP